MSLTGKDIAEIARLLDASRFAELDLQQGAFRLRIRRAGAAPPDDDEDEASGGEVRASGGRRPPASAPARAGREAPAQPAADQPVATPPAADQPAPTLPSAGEVDILAPLPGNFYIAPRPGEPPFVKPGDTLAPDTIVAIIEVMKLMNPVSAGVGGTLVAVLAQDGAAIVADQPLFRVRQG